jgi:aldose 1-epimerase
MTRAVFGLLPDGRAVERLTLAAGDLRVSILTLGAILQDVRLNGVAFPLTLGSPDLAAYAGPMAYCGAIVGPVANRIAGAEIAVAGRTHRLIANENGRTTLHGGTLGTHARLWTVTDLGPAHATLTLDLDDGAEGYPGQRRLTARFTATAPARLDLVLEAETDAPSPTNLANHSYWSLGPDGLDGHLLEIAADRYTPVDADLIPTGTAVPVDGTAFDFRAARPIGAAAEARYDHNFCLAASRRAQTFAARLTGPTGIALTIATTEPGLQVYDAARLDTAPHAGLSGQPYGAFAGVALEAQAWPDAPHHPDFPPILLEPWRRRGAPLVPAPRRG